MGRFEALHGRKTGSGQQTVILSHGFGTDQDAWAALRPWFEAHFQVLSFDLAGCGPEGAGSYDFSRYDSLFGYADDLLDIMDELDVQNCTLVGHSMSGMIGAVAACAQPERFDRLVMIGASPRYLNDGDYFGGFEQSDLEPIFESMSANYQAWVAGFAPMVVGVEDNAMIKEFSRTLFQMRPDIALNTSRTIFESDLRQTAARVPVPVHIIQTSADMAVPVEVGRWMSNAILDSTLDVIDASGHLPHMTAPLAVRQILEQRLVGEQA